MQLLMIFLKPYRGFSKETWRLLLAGFINSMALIVAIYISLYLNALHYSIHQIGAVLTFYGLCSVAGAYAGGAITDKLDPLTTCKISLFSSGILFFLFPLLKQYSLIFCISGLISFCASIFRPAFILALATGEKSGSLEKIAALRRVAINLGMALGAGIGGFLANKNFSYVFIFDACAILLALFFILNMQNVLDNAPTENKTAQQTKISQRYFFINLVLIFLVMLIFNQSQATYPLFLKNVLSLNAKQISWLFTLSGVMIALLQVPITNLLQFINSYLVCTIGIFFIGLGFFMLPWSHHIDQVMLSCALWTLGEIIFFPSQLAAIIRLTGNRKGKSMGIYQMVFSAATFFSPAIGTSIYAYHVNLLWYLCGLISLIAIAICLTLFRTTHNNQVNQ